MHDKFWDHLWFLIAGFVLGMVLVISYQMHMIAVRFSQQAELPKGSITSELTVTENPSFGSTNYNPLPTTYNPQP